MKKLIVITLLSAFLIPTTFAQLNIGVKGGLGLASMSVKDNDDTFNDNRKPKLGLHAGGVVGYTFIAGLSVEGGFLFALKGVKYKEIDAGDTYKDVVRLFYIVIPITAKYTYDLGAVGLYGQLGPYIGIGLAGSVRSVNEIDGDRTVETESILWGNTSSNDLKRFDMGLTLGLGVLVFNSLQAGLFMEQGLANISASTHNGRKVKNSVFGLSVVYYFGKS